VRSWLSRCETGAQVSKWLKDNAESKHAAVYAVVGKDETVNFVGVGRNVALSVAAHLANEGEDMVHLLKVRVPRTDTVQEFRRFATLLCAKMSTSVSSIRTACILNLSTLCQKPRGVAALDVSGLSTVASCGSHAVTG